MPHTIAVKVDGTVYTHTINDFSLGSGDALSLPSGNVYIEASGLNIVFAIPSGVTISNIEWVALYEGEYTTETLPEYHPKGYAAELVECQRYYQIRSTNNIAAVDMRPTMRLRSPTITAVTGGYAYSADL